ncbi:helix-turn-helix domain-containing protein [Priestia megaterium]|uniref:helix-turn-helix domain-containing protein n=1 Tax=Priestia megaterium TaxID=1404 RepID=UPI0034E46719
MIKRKKLCVHRECIRQLRKEKGLTARGLSEQLNIPFTTLGNYERKGRQPSFEKFNCLAKYFNGMIVKQSSCPLYSIKYILLLNKIKYMVI